MNALLAIGAAIGGAMCITKSPLFEADNECTLIIEEEMLTRIFNKGRGDFDFTVETWYTKNGRNYKLKTDSALTAESVQRDLAIAKSHKYQITAIVNGHKVNV